MNLELGRDYKLQRVAKQVSPAQIVEEFVHCLIMKLQMTGSFRRVWFALMKIAIFMNSLSWMAGSHEEMVAIINSYIEFGGDHV